MVVIIPCIIYDGALPAFKFSDIGINHNENNSYAQFRAGVERARERGSARGRKREKGVHESYAQCGCSARLGEFVTASGGYLRREWVHPRVQPIFSLSTIYVHHLDVNIHAGRACIFAAFLAAADRNKYPSRN